MDIPHLNSDHDLEPQSSSFVQVPNARLLISVSPVALHKELQPRSSPPLAVRYDEPEPHGIASIPTPRPLQAFDIEAQPASNSAVLSTAHCPNHLHVAHQPINNNFRSSTSSTFSQAFHRLTRIQRPSHSSASGFQAQTTRSHSRSSSHSHPTARLQSCPCCTCLDCVGASNLPQWYNSFLLHRQERSRIHEAHCVTVVDSFPDLALAHIAWLGSRLDEENWVPKFEKEIRSPETRRETMVRIGGLLGEYAIAVSNYDTWLKRDPSVARAVPGQFKRHRVLLSSTPLTDGFYPRIRRLMLALCGAFAVVIPMFILLFLRDRSKLLLPVTLCTVLFFAVPVALYFDNATGKEIVGAMASYASVMVMFMTGLGNGNHLKHSDQ